MATLLYCEIPENILTSFFCNSAPLGEIQIE